MKVTEKVYSQTQDLIQMESIQSIETSMLCSPIPSSLEALSLRQQHLQTLLFHHGHLTLTQEYTALLDAKIQLEMANLSAETPQRPRGRGGNNTAENIKKSLISIFKSRLPAAVYADFEQEALRAHGLRSQKENVLVFFLYLHKYCLQRRLPPDTPQEVTLLLRRRVTRYIANSREKMEFEPDRREFHLKNIREFERFLEMDLCLEGRPSFEEVAGRVRGFYLRKATEFTKAAQRLAKIVHSDPLLQSLLSQLPPSPQERLKEEERVETESSCSPPE